jgi:hypothetical protein
VPEERSNQCSAFILGLEICDKEDIKRDAVADPDPQDREALMNSIFPSLARVIDTAGRRSLLNDSHPNSGQ